MHNLFHFIMAVHVAAPHVAATAHSAWVNTFHPVSGAPVQGPSTLHPALTVNTFHPVSAPVQGPSTLHVVSKVAAK